MNNDIGVCLVGAHGAVATTIMAGVALIKRGLAPRTGMMTEGNWLKESLDLPPLESLVFGGWDLRAGNAYQAALSHQVIPPHQLESVKEDLQSVEAWPGVVSSKFLDIPSASHQVSLKSFRDELRKIEEDILAFQAKYGFRRTVMVNLTSTEKFCELAEVHQTLKNFEIGLDNNDDRISPSMKYLYVACKMGIPHINFTPSLSKVPALEQLAKQYQVPIAGEDGKTGQTLIKTVLAPAFAIRHLQVDGWYSTNILGNHDGLILNNPESNRTKVTSKQNVLNSILGYEVEDHQVHIHYYRPRGDAKEAWDNIDLSGFLGERMQLKVDFLCKDSILAAPLVIDLIRLMDCAARQGELGIQRQFSLFFKAPYHAKNEVPLHDFFKQNELFTQWVDGLKSKDKRLSHHSKNYPSTGPTAQAIHSTP